MEGRGRRGEGWSSLSCHVSSAILHPPSRLCTTDLVSPTYRTSRSKSLRSPPRHATPLRFAPLCSLPPPPSIIRPPLFPALSPPFLPSPHTISKSSFYLPDSLPVPIPSDPSSRPISLPFRTLTYPYPPCALPSPSLPTPHFPRCRWLTSCGGSCKSFGPAKHSTRSLLGEGGLATRPCSYSPLRSARW